MTTTEQSWSSAYQQYEADNPNEPANVEDFLAGWNAALAYATDQMQVLVVSIDFARG